MQLGNQAMILSNNVSISGNLQENRSINPNDSTHFDQIVVSSDKVCISRNSRKKIVGVTKRKSGKYGVKLHDRLRKKTLWLGTFDTPEEASKVYLDKKKELAEELQGYNRKFVRLGKRTSKYVGVSTRDSGKFAAHIRDPIRKKKLYLGAFETEEEAAEVYLAKYAELEEEVKGTGIKWTSNRECRRAMRLEITKNSDTLLDQCIEENNSDRFLDDPAMNIDNDSKPGSTAANSSILEENNDAPCLEDNQESLKEIDSNSDSSNGESALRDAVPEENLEILEDDNDDPCSENREPSNGVDNFDSCHIESASMDSRVSNDKIPIQRNGGSAEEDLIVVDSSGQSMVNPGAKILLRIQSGTPLMDSNGFLLGKWSWIDDLTLPISM